MDDAAAARTVVWLGVDDPEVRAEVRRAIGDAAFARFVAIAGSMADAPRCGPPDARTRPAIASQIDDLRDDVETALEAGDPSLLDDAIRSALAFVGVVDGASGKVALEALPGTAARISHPHRRRPVSL